MRRDKMEAAGKVPLMSGVVPLPSGVVGIHRSTLNSARWSPGHSADAVSRAAPLGAATFLALGINKAPNKAPTSGQDQEISTFSSSPRGTAREISSSPAMNRSPVDLFATFSRSPEQATEGLDGMNVITGEIRNRRTSKSGEKEATALDTRPSAGTPNASPERATMADGGDLQCLLEQASSLKTEIKTIGDDHSKLQGDNRNLREALVACRCERDEALKRFEDTLRQLHREQKECLSQQISLEEVKRSRDELYQEVKELREKFSHVEVSNEENQVRTNSEKQILQLQVKQLQEIVQRQGLSAAEYQNSFAKCKHELEESRSKEASLREEIDKIKEQCARLEDRDKEHALKYLQLKKQLTDVPQLMVQLEQAQNEIQRLSSENCTIMDQLVAKSAHADEIETNTSAGSNPVRNEEQGEWKKSSGVKPASENEILNQEVELEKERLARRLVCLEQIFLVLRKGLEAGIFSKAEDTEALEHEVLAKISNMSTFVTPANSTRSSRASPALHMRDTPSRGPSMSATPIPANATHNSQASPAPRSRDTPIRRSMGTPVPNGIVNHTASPVPKLWKKGDTPRATEDDTISKPPADKSTGKNLSSRMSGTPKIVGSNRSTLNSESHVEPRNDVPTLKGASPSTSLGEISRGTTEPPLLQSQSVSRPVSDGYSGNAVNSPAPGTPQEALPSSSVADVRLNRDHPLVQSIPLRVLKIETQGSREASPSSANAIQVQNIPLRVVNDVPEAQSSSLQSPTVQTATHGRMLISVLPTTTKEVSQPRSLIPGLATNERKTTEGIGIQEGRSPQWIKKNGPERISSHLAQDINSRTSPTFIPLSQPSQAMPSTPKAAGRLRGDLKGFLESDSVGALKVMDRQPTAQNFASLNTSPDAPKRMDHRGVTASYFHQMRDIANTASNAPYRSERPTGSIHTLRSMYERESTTHKSGNGERRMSIHGAVLSGYTTLSKGYTSHQAMQSQGGQNVTYNHANSCGVPLHQRVDTSKSLQAHLDATDQRQVSSYAVSPHRHVYSYGGGTFGGATSLSTTQVGQGGPAHAGRSVYRPYVPGDRAAIQFC